MRPAMAGFIPIDSASRLHLPVEKALHGVGLHFRTLSSVLSGLKCLITAYSQLIKLICALLVVRYGRT